MAQIPLYKSKVAPTTQIPSAQASPEMAALPFKQLEKLGAVASDVAFDYAARTKKLREDGETSKYEVQSKQLLNTIAEARHEATIKGVQAEDMQKDIIDPILNDFENSIGDMSKSKSMQREFNERWALDREGILSREGIERHKIEQADYTVAVKSEGDMLLREGKFEQADAAYDKLVGVIGEGGVKNMKSGSRYDWYTTDIGAIMELAAEGRMKPEETFRLLEEIREDVRSDENLALNHFGAIDRNLTAQITNFKGRKNKDLTKVVDNVFDKLSTDELEESDLAQVYASAGPDMGEALDNSMNAQFKEGVAVNDEDAVVIQGYLDEMVSGDRGWAESVRLIGKKNSSYGVLGLFVANSYAKDIVNSQEPSLAYEQLGTTIDIPISVDADTKNYVHTLTYYMSRKSTGHGGYLNEKLRAFSKWQKAPGDVSYEDFRKQQFGEDAHRDAYNKKSPSVRQAPVKNRVVVGRKTDKDGNVIAIQYSDGTIEEIN